MDIADRFNLVFLLIKRYERGFIVRSFLGLIFTSLMFAEYPAYCAEGCQFALLGFLMRMNI